MNQNLPPQPNCAPTLTPIKALRRILSLWHTQAVRLVGGIVLALLALCFGLALMQTTGLRVASTVLGTTIITATALKFIGVGRILLRYAERLFAHDAMFRALANLRVWFFRSLAHGAAAGLGFRRSGDMLSRLVSDIGSLDGLYLRIIVPFTCACLTLPILILMLGKQSVLLSAIIGALFASSAFFIPYMIGRASRHKAERLTHALASLRISVLDLIGGLREIRVFGAEKRMLHAVEQTDATLIYEQMALARRSSLASACAFLMGQCAILLVLLAITDTFALHITPLAGVGCLFLVVAAFESAGTLTKAGLQIGAMGVSAQRVVEIANVPSVTDPMVPQLLAPQHPDLSFAHVTFRWSIDRPYVFKDLSLDIKAGSRVALLGPSGAGKSTLAALLLKVVAPESGSILFDSVSLADVETTSLRQRIAWLSQSTHLFDDSIRANLLLGRPEATEDDLWRALDEAAIADVVRNLPEGLDTWLGEGGIRLSGGQGRRIALARTLLTRAPILILDEPATGLDAQTEQEFLATLNRVTLGRTVILIAHRLTGIEQLDHVWRISNGQAAEVPLMTQY